MSVILHSNCHLRELSFADRVKAETIGFKVSDGVDDR